MTNRFRQVAIILVCFLLSGSVPGQDLLTLDDAIRTTLENNFGIRVAQKNIEIAANNASRTAVGYHPTLNASAGTNYDVGGSKQQFSSGQENTVSSAATLAGNANITGNYVILDQTRRVSLQQLKEVLNLSNLQLRQTVELNVLQVAALYYEIAKLAANVDVLHETIEVSNRRVERVQYQYDYGSGTALDVLNAEVDVQRDSINYYNMHQQLALNKRNLNVLMGTSVDADLQVDTTVVYASPDLGALATNAEAENINLLLSRMDQTITRYDLDLIEAERKPTLSATGAYRYNFSDNPPGAFITSSNSRGFSLGLTANWNLFDGGMRKLRAQNTRISLETQSLQEELIRLEVNRDLQNAWDSYQNALFILQSEAVTLSTSQRNFERTEEQFNLGQVSSVEFRQAQLNLLNASTNYNNAKYDSKILELELLQIAGMLLDA